MEIKWSPLAVDNLTSILEYVEQEFGRKTSQNVYQQLETLIKRLSQFSTSGILDERFCSSVYEARHLISAPNIIYYLIYKDEIIIVSILDCRRSPDFISEQIDTFLKLYSK